MHMIYIEKIDVSNELSIAVNGEKTYPGLVDIFLNKKNYDKYLAVCVSNTANYYGDLVTERLKENGIILGGRYGFQGISINQLLEQSVTNDQTYYEMSIRHYVCLSRSEQYQLAERFRLVLHDFLEGGENLFYNNPTSLKLGNNTREIIIAISGYENYDHLGTNVRTVSLPLYAHMVVSKFAEKKQIPNPNWEHLPSKLAMLMIRKPKPVRLELLSYLDDKGLLDNCTWSFAVNIDNRSDLPKMITPVNWRPSLDSPKYADFIRKHKSKFPLLLPGEELNSFNPLTLDPIWANSHKWYILCETNMTRYFVTEKTFKGMMLGMPVLPVAKAGYNQLLCKLGFSIPLDFDHLSGDERAKAVVNYILTTEPDISQAQHNFDLLNNKQFMVKLATQPLIDLFYPS